MKLEEERNKGLQTKKLNSHNYPPQKTANNHHQHQIKDESLDGQQREREGKKLN